MMDMSASPRAPRSHRKIDPVAVLEQMKRGKGAYDIAHELRVTPQAVYNAINLHARGKPTPAPPPAPKVDMDVVVKMAQQGLTTDQIAAHFKCHATTVRSAARRAGVKLRGLRAAVDKAQPVPAPAPYAAPVAKKPLRVAAPAMDTPDLPQGYIAELIATKGKYVALESWRAKFAPLIGRRIDAAKALQEWHKYRGA